MRNFRLIPMLCVLGFTLLLTMPVRAMIFMDEDFEDGTAFTDQNWPVQDYNTTLPTLVQIQSTQGINIRSYDATAGYTSPKVVMNNSGTVSTADAFNGTRSLRLASGDSMAVNGNGAYTQAGLNWYNVVQFALAVDAATLTQPVGTQVGHYTMNYSTDNPVVLTSTEVTYSLNLVRNATGGLDIQVVATPGAATPVTVGAITAAGQWSVVTVMVQREIVEGANDGLENWECWDPNTTTYKGPQPTGNPIGDGTGNGTGTYQQVQDGISVFVNSNTAANRLSAATIGANFCNSPAQGAGAKANDTVLLNWEIAAENGGTLFIDDTFWAHGAFQDGKAINLANKEGAARLDAFDAAPVVPTPTVVPQAGSSTWSLYNE